LPQSFALYLHSLKIHFLRAVFYNGNCEWGKKIREIVFTTFRIWNRKIHETHLLIRRQASREESTKKSTKDEQGQGTGD